MQASRPALKTIQPPVIRPAYKTGIIDDAGYSQKTLIEALNQIDPRVFNTKNDTGLYEKLHVELMLKNDPAKFRDATSTYLALISGAASAGIPLANIDQWAERDPDYCTVADASSRRSNYLAYSGQHKETFFKIYHAYCRTYQQDDILNKETEARDRLQCWIDRGFRPSFMPFERDEKGNVKQTKLKLKIDDIASFIEAVSNTADVELYFDIGSNSRVCRSQVFSFDNERGLESFIAQTLQNIGYSEFSERSFKLAATRYFDTHKDNGFSRFLARRGICANNWDGVPRVDALFTDALGLSTEGAQTADYLKSVSRYLFTGMLELSHYSALKGTAPKVEIMPVFQSDLGGVGKNTLINALTFDAETAGDFHTTIDPYDFVTKSPRDIYLDCAGCVLAELGDVPFGKVDIVRKLKYKLSEQSTKYSVKFEMFNTKGVRHFMYVATTNDRGCLNTTYGGVERRFAVVTFDHNVIDAINQQIVPNIDQLYCEAMHIYETQGGLQYKELDEILKGGSIAEEHSITADEEAEINLIIDREECLQVVADATLKEVHISPASIKDLCERSAETRRVSKQIIKKVLENRGYTNNKTTQRIRRFVWNYDGKGGTVITSDPCRVWTRKVKAEEKQGIRARAEDYRQIQTAVQPQMTIQTDKWSFRYE
jgi:predicted P-loop ATPase